MADSIHKLQERLQQLQSEVVDISIRKSMSEDQLEDLDNEIETAQEKLDLVNKAFKMKYEELTEIYLKIELWASSHLLVLVELPLKRLLSSFTRRTGCSSAFKLADYYLAVILLL
jgi:hypothetical protein